MIIGGGSGHYPTLVGFVGTGVADGTVIGDILGVSMVYCLSTVGRTLAAGQARNATETVRHSLAAIVGKG